ncbi:MAG TPA: mechanosensitive ion channel family protein [Roseivirga sp.]
MEQLKLKFSKAVHPATNFIGGVLLRIFKPFAIGDFIEVNGLLGYVEFKGASKTLIRSLDNSEMVVENGLFYKKPFYNLTHLEIKQIDLQINIPYTEDMKLVKSMIHDYVRVSNTIRQTPAAKIYVKRIQASCVELGIKAWCTSENYLDAGFLTEASLKDYLKGRGISIKTTTSEENHTFKPTQISQLLLQS